MILKVEMQTVSSAAIQQFFSVLRSRIFNAQFITTLQMQCLLSLAKKAHQIGVLFLIRFLVLCGGLKKYCSCLSSFIMSAL